jgi:hypothetical protein
MGKPERRITMIHFSETSPPRFRVFLKFVVAPVVCACSERRVPERQYQQDPSRIPVALGLVLSLYQRPQLRVQFPIG